MLFAKFRGWMAGKEAAAHAQRIDRLISAGKPWAQSDVDQSVIFWSQGWRLLYSHNAIKPLPHLPRPSGLFEMMLCFFVNELGEATARNPRFADLPVDKLWVEIAAGVILSKTHSEREVTVAMQTREIRRVALLRESKLS